VNDKLTCEELEQRVRELERAEIERKQAEVALRESEFQKSIILDSTSELVGYYDTDLKIIWVNTTAASSVGKSSKEMIGAHCYTFWNHSNEPCSGCPVIKARDEKMPQQIEKRTPDGRHWSIRAFPIFDKKDRVIGLAEFTCDITERKQAEEVLEAERGQLRSLFEYSGEAILLLDLENHILNANTGFERIFGYSLEEARGKIIEDLICPARFYHMESKELDELSLNGIKNVEIIRRRKDGEEINVRVSAGPIKLGDRMTGRFVVFDDITETKRAEEALRESEERFRTIFESLSAGSCLDELVYDENGKAVDYRILNVNPAYERIMGISRSEAINALGSQIYGTGEAPFLEVFSRVAQTGDPESFETYFEPARKHLEFNVSSPAKERFSTVFTDITERRQAEEALQDSERRLRTSQRTARIGHVDYNVNTGDILWSEMMYVLYERNPALGPPTYEEVMSLHWPEDVRKQEEHITKAVASGEPYALDLRVSLPSRRQAIFHAIGTPVKNEEGKVVSITGTVQDVTERFQAEEALRREEEKFRMLVENTVDWVWQVDEGGYYIYASPQARTLIGYEIDEINGKTPFDFMPSVEAERVSGIFFDALKNREKILNLETVLLTKSGYEVIFETNATPLFNSSGEFKGYMGTCRDITENKKSEEALQESHKKFANIFNNTSDAIFIHDMQGHFLEVNQVACERLGYSKSEMLEKSPMDIDAPEFAHLAEQRFRDIEREGELTFESAHLRKDGKLIPVEINSKLIDYEGEPCLLSVARDITKRQQAEKKLHESEEKFQKAFRNAPIPMTITSVADGRFVDVNDAFVSLTGYSRGKAIGATSTGIGFANSEDRDRMIHILESEGRVKNLELTVQKADGSKMICLYSAEVVEMMGEKQLLSTAIDITDREIAEEALRESERRFRTLFEAAPVSILATKNGKYSMANPASARLLGYETPDEIIGLDALSTIAPEHHDIILQRMSNIDTNQENAPIEISILNPDGGISWSMSTSVPIELEGKPAALIIGQDITYQKQAEVEKERLLSAIEQAAEVIVITDSDGLIQYVNPAFEKITGYTADEVKGENPRILKSGKQDAAFYRNLWATITEGKTWQCRLINKKKDGTLYTEEASISPVIDKEGQIHNFVAVKRDITSEIEMESRLAQAQKMEAIGTLAGGIAHDFNNILSAILGFAELVEEELPAGSESRSDLEEVLKAAQRAKGLVKQILTFSRHSKQEAIPLRMELIVKEALQMLRSSLPSSIEVRHSIGIDLPRVVADPIQVHQILLNLCTNAAQAMEKESGTLEVLLDTKDFDKEAIIQTGRLSPGSYVRLCVSDTGSGIPKDLLERIFEPYFTTKKAGEGTGLGLAVVYGIVKDYGGGIAVESELGKGTTFTLYLPEAEEAEPIMVEVRQSRLPWGKERILLVDDELPIIKLGKEYLVRLGYDVVTMQDSTDALEIFRKDPGRFDLVITDMTMPKMTGDELASAILEIRPEMPIIICTGYSKRMSPERAKEIGIRAFVMKPLAHHELADTVRVVLDERH